MEEHFRPTPLEFETLIRFRAKSRIEALKHRLEQGWAGGTDDGVVAEANERLSELAEEVGQEEVDRIVQEIENQQREMLGDDLWRLLTEGTAEQQAAFADAREQESHRRIQIHNVTGGIESGNWLHTHGMDVLGLPELEIRGVPSYFTDAAAQLLREVCSDLRTFGKGERITETVLVGPNSSVRFARLPPVVGSEDHFESERWALVGSESICCECGAVACSDDAHTHEG